MVIPFTPEAWQQVLTILQGQMSQATFDVNLRGTRLIRRRGDQLTIEGSASKSYQSKGYVLVATREKRRPPS